MADRAHDDWLMDLMTRPLHPEIGFYEIPDHDEAPPHGDAAEMARHVVWLMADPGRRLAPYDDAMLARGLHWLFDGAEWEMFRAIGSPAVAPAERRAAILGLPRLFEQALCPRLARRLGHLSEDGGALGAFAYMLTENLYLEHPVEPAEAAAMNDDLLTAWGGILALPHAAAQESALHALGHWHEGGRARAVALIDAFLAEGRADRPELVRYAQAARTGCIL